MQKRAIALTTLLFCLLAVSVVYASYALTVMHTEFNSATRSNHATGYAKSSWTVTITNNLNFNSTEYEGKYATIFIANSSSTGYYAISVVLMYSENGYYLDLTVPTKVDPSGSDWERAIVIENLPIGEPIKITLNEKGQLSVFSRSKLYLDKYQILTAFPAEYIQCQGSSEWVALSGNVKFEVTGYTETPTQTVLSWLPIVLTFAMLSIALTMLRKYT